MAVGLTGEPWAREVQAAMFLALFGIGLTQVIWVAPLVLWARRIGERRTMKGIVIAAALTLLCNGACFAVFWGRTGRMGG